MHFPYRLGAAAVVMAGLVFFSIGGPLGHSLGDRVGRGAAVSPATPVTGDGPALRAPLPSAPPLRGEFSKEWVAKHLRATLGAPPRTSVVDAACPKFVFAFQNHNAGIGHRMTNWAMALHTAVTFNVTFAHTSFDGGSGGHGSFDGWDGWLSFTSGELGLDDVMARKGIRTVELPSVGGYYGYNEATVARWAPLISDPTQCNVIYKVPQDQWMFDISSSTKALMAWKFAEHTAPRRPAELAHWSAGEVNIAVHVRFGDQYPTKEHTHARIVRETVLPALREAGVRAQFAVHVFAEEKAGEQLPLLKSLEREKGVSVYFHPEASPMASFWHLTEADFLVASFSSFSWAAAQVALRPLALMQPSSDIMKMCADFAACCNHDGTCGFAAAHRATLAAERLHDFFSKRI